MANKRLLYAAEALFVSTAPATGVQSGTYQQLHRVQTIGYDFNRQLENVQEMGTYPYIDRVPLTLPTTTLNVSYLSTNIANESGIGLYVLGDKTALANILAGTTQEQNYYLRVVPDGNSADGYTGTDGGVVGFGNGVLASYQAQGRVGSFPTCSFSIQALDINWVNTSANFDTPAIDPVQGVPISGIAVTLPVATTGQVGQITALRPGDITVNLNGGGFGIHNICIQSYDVSMNLNLEPIICLGSKYATSREINFPIECRMAVEANMRDLGTGRLSNLQCDQTKYELDVTLRTPTCDGTLGQTKCQYSLKGAILESQSFNSTIGPMKTVTLNFSAPIGGPQDLSVGLFVSGSTL